MLRENDMDFSIKIFLPLPIKSKWIDIYVYNYGTVKFTKRLLSKQATNMKNQNNSGFLIKIFYFLTVSKWNKTACKLL